MKYGILFASALVACCMTGQMMAAQDKPVIKVDFNEPSRKDNEVLEPGFTAWAFPKDTRQASLTVEGVTFTVSSEQNMRAGWNKAFVQEAVENSKLTGDGVVFDPKTLDGVLELSIKGLPAGTHTIQTYHNSWQDPASYTGWPIHILVGDEEKALIHRTFRKTSLAEAAIAMFSFQVLSESDEVIIKFRTSIDDDDPDDLDKTSYDVTPLLNGFELNTVSAAAQSKKPYPADGDMHADVDGGSVLLTWSPAGGNIVRHRLYFGTDAALLAAADTTSALYMGALTDTVCAKEGLDNLHTYYWRVDEVDTDGKTTVGNVWSFRPRHLAFPGAEGYGRYANGGRGGRVVYVTNLNSSGPGSFREAIKNGSGPRTILFMVSGLIDMQLEKLFIDDDLTIAGQSAPGKGICLAHCDLGIGDDNICRFLRFRRGISTNGNAMGVAGCDHTIVDHVSTSWGTDETVSGRNAQNITFQYSMISEALGISHGFAATIGGKIGSWHHNFLVNCSGRNWSMAGNLDGGGNYITQMDLFNNVVYNWWKRTTDGSAHEVNFVNNVYKMGPDSNKKYLFEMQHQGYGMGTNRAYVSGNIRINKDGSVTEDKLNDTYRIDISDGVTIDYETFVDEPFFPSYATIHSARDAYKIVLSDMGANQPLLDDHDRRNVREALEGSWTYTGAPGYRGQIDSEEDAGGFEVYPEEVRPTDFDTDLDGLPDWWEKMFGSNPASPSEDFSDSNADPDGDGYTALEDYLEFLAHPHLILLPGEEKTLDVKQLFEGFTASPVYSLEGESGAGVRCNLEGQVFRVTASAGAETLVRLVLKVTDSEGSTYSRPLGLAVTPSKPTALEQLPDGDHASLVRIEVYAPDGRLVKTVEAGGKDIHAQDFSGLERGLWVVRAVDERGRRFGYKIIRH
ncbi:MAG: T9SS C-terminal target domain-containing protein [Bacteroidales bacterium]|nr:T9SS C-terminal target domain-containing protein [Bacteroidales bacterium]